MIMICTCAGPRLAIASSDQASLTVATLPLHRRLRVTTALTCMVATFALLYSISQHLPKLPFLTTIDITIIIAVLNTGALL